MYKLFLIKKDNPSYIIKEFNESEIEFLNSSINALIQNSKMTWAFFVISENYSSLFDNANKNFEQLSKSIKNIDWEQLESVTKILNKDLFNFVASLKTFIEYSEHYISKTFGEEKLSEYKTLQNEVYDNNFSYRLFCNLRNSLVHFGYSLTTISFEVSSKIVFIPKFSIVELKKYKNWQAQLKKDLSTIHDDFTAFDLIKITLKNFSTLNNHLDGLIRPQNQKHSDVILKILDMEKVVLSQYCFKIDNNGKEKISQIPIHLL